MTIKKYYEAIPVAQLRVDETLDAQRMFESVWARKLARIWDPELLLVATVSRRIDGNYLIDGQHSTKVALDKEGPDFLRDCMVYEGLTRQMEARLFLAANRDRKQVRHYDIFRVGLTAGDPIASRMEKEVRSCGLALAPSTSANKIGAVAAIRTIAERREGLVARVLGVIDQAWGRTPAAWDRMMLYGIAIAIEPGNWNRVDDERLATVLQTKAVATWKADAMAASLSGGGGGSTSRSYPLARLIISRYNLRLRNKDRQLLPLPRDQATEPR